MRSACLTRQMHYSGRARKGFQPIATFDSGGQTTCVSTPDLAAAMSGVVLAGQQHSANPSTGVAEDASLPSQSAPM